METLASIFSLPIIILNFFGFIGAAIWLLVAGQWRSVIAGIFICVIANFLLTIALLPMLALQAPAMYFAKRRVTIGVYFFGFLGSVYTYVLIAAWCGGITYYFLHDAAPGTFWPHLIWAYGIATAPWTYLARKDESVSAAIAAFFMQVAYIVMMIAIALGVSLSNAVDVFGVVLGVGVLVHMQTLAQANRLGLFDE